MTDEWARATFAGTQRAQANLIAGLTPAERLGLLEELLEVAQVSGALERSRRQKQDAIDALWA